MLGRAAGAAGAAAATSPRLGSRAAAALAPLLPPVATPAPCVAPCSLNARSTRVTTLLSPSPLPLLYPARSTRAIYSETLSNPTLAVADIPALAALARRRVRARAQPPEHGAAC